MSSSSLSSSLDRHHHLSDPRRSLACIQIIHSIILHRVSNRAGFLSRDSINSSPRYPKPCWLCTTFGRFEKTVKNRFLCSVIQMRNLVKCQVVYSVVIPWNWLPFYERWIIIQVRSRVLSFIMGAPLGNSEDLMVWR